MVDWREHSECTQIILRANLGSTKRIVGARPENTQRIVRTLKSTLREHSRTLQGSKSGIQVAHCRVQGIKS